MENFVDSALKPATKKNINFHMHNIDSMQKDTFANATPEQSFEYINYNAKKYGIKNCIAFTNHDNFLWNGEQLTLAKFRDIEKAYPQTDITLGAECNTSLVHATNGIFDQAHITCYANMSSDETISKWVDSKELNAYYFLKNLKIENKAFSPIDIFDKINKSLKLTNNIDIGYNSFDAIRNGTYKDIDEYKTAFDQKMIPVLKREKLFAMDHTDEEILKHLNSFSILDEKQASDFAFLRSVDPYSSTNNPISHHLKNYFKRINHYFPSNPFSKKEWKKLDQQNLPNLPETVLDLVAKRILSSIRYDKKDLFTKVRSAGPQYDKIEMIKDIIIKKEISTNGTYADQFATHTELEQIGQKLICLTSAINTHFNVAINLADVANICTENSNRYDIINKFCDLACLHLQIAKVDGFSQNMSLSAQKINLLASEFSYFGIKYKFEDMLLDNVFNKTDHFSTLMRYDLVALSSAVKNAGGYVCLAHPDSIFSLMPKHKIDKSYFENMDFSSLSESKKKELQKRIYEHGYVSTTDITGSKNFVLRLEILLNALNRNNVKLDAIEISKTMVKTPEILINVLIFCAKHNLEVSFGNDVHISEKFYDFLTMSPAKFAVRERELTKMGDPTAREKYKCPYEKINSTKKVLSNSLEKCRLEKAVLKSDKKVAPVNVGNNYTINNTSLYQLVKSGKKNLNPEKVLFEITQNIDSKEQNMVFTNGALKNAKYIIIDGEKKSKKNDDMNL